MCTNYRLTKTITDIYVEFSQNGLPVLLPERHVAPNLKPQPEIRPTDRAVVLRGHQEGVELARMRWGLVPWFHRGPVKAWKLATFNARAETVKTARSFRYAFERRRCLIAADGWVEWKGEGKPKPKFYIDRNDAAPICFAGIWDRCESDEGHVESFTMVTQPPGALSDVHDRAPVVLTQADWARWLDTSADVDDLLTAAPPDLYRIRPYVEVAAVASGAAAFNSPNLI